MEKWATEISRTKERGRIRREKLKLEQVWEIEQKQIGTFLTTVSWCLKITEKVSFNIANEASYVFENLKLAVK